jgi:membrane protein YqaA with SNARE-associated domain
VKKHALDIAAFVWGVAEATLFFFVPDVLLSYIGLKRGVKDAARASLIAAVGAGVGGAIMYAWSATDPAAARAAVLAVPAISEAMAARAAEAMAGNWFAATFLGPLTSTPFKLFAILAPHAGAHVAAFALAGVIARLPRFLLAALGAALIARWLTPRFGERALTWALAGFWVLFYVVFFALMPH